MAKYHITPDGPRPCTATKRACPVGGEHFNHVEFAEAAYELQFGGALQGVKKARRLPETAVAVPVQPFAGGRYFGCHVDKASVAPHLEAFRAEVGPERAAIMEDLKAQRDRGYVYHLTVVTPPEMKQAKVGLTPFPAQAIISYEGVGRAVDGPNEAWFVVCGSPLLDRWREENSLPPKDFHITLGFEPKDVHTKPKGAETIVVS